MIDVVQVVTRTNIGGISRYLELLHGRLDPAEFRTTLLRGRVGEDEGLHEITTGEVIDLDELGRPIRPLADWRSYRELRKHFEAHRPDVVHTHMAKAGAVGRLAAYRAKVPLIVHTYHGHVLDSYFSRPVTEGFLRLERYLARKTDLLVAVSNEIRDDLLRLGIGRAEQWHVLPYKLDIEGLASSTLLQDQARLSLGLAAEGTLVGIAGRLVPIKDHATFLEAAHLVRRRFPSARFVVAGDGELRQDLENRARELLGDGVSFLGWVGDLAAMYRSLDVLVLTSRNEGTPLALIEGAAAGLPVVSTDVGGVSAIMVDGSTGHLAPAGDAAAVAEAIGSLLEDPLRSRAMGQAGRAFVMERFSASGTLTAEQNLYKDGLSQKRTSRNERR